MSQLTQLAQRLAEYQAADAAAGSLQDITAIRTRAIRRAFEKNASFFGDIKALYGIVREQSGARADGETDASKAARILYVALTADRHFFGSLIRRIIEQLVSEIAAHPDADAIVIGSVGWELYAELGEPARAQFQPLAGETPSPEELTALAERFNEYDRVFILHPSFVNVFRQDVVMEDITHSPEQLPQPAAAAFPEGFTPVPGIPEEALRVAAQAGGYILEPDADMLVGFFDTQVRRVLFGRVLLESELSRTAARLMRLTESQSRAQALAGTTERAIMQATAARAGAELLETFAGLAAWRRV